MSNQTKRCAHITKSYLIAAFGFAIVLLLSGCASSGSNAKTINLMEYITVAITGDSGYGKASYLFDYGAFEEALAEALDGDINSVQFFSDAAIIEEGISISFDKTSDLSNGDTVVLTVTYDNTAAENYKISFEGGTTTYTAEGLTEIEEFSAEEDNVIELLSETTVLYYTQHIPVSPENISNFEMTDFQVDYQRNTAQVDYSYELDCKIAVLSVSGSVQFKYEDNAWVSAHISHSAQIKEYTLSGTYTGAEWDIAASGVSCNATYEITDNGDGTYTAVVTWSANEDSPGMEEITTEITLLDSFDMARFVITDNSAQSSAIGRAPYLYRALKFDFINGGLYDTGAVELLKVSD